MNEIKKLVTSRRRKPNLHGLWSFKFSNHWLHLSRAALRHRKMHYDYRVASLIGSTPNHRFREISCFVSFAYYHVTLVIMTECSLCRPCVTVLYVSDLKNTSTLYLIYLSEMIELEEVFSLPETLEPYHKRNDRICSSGRVITVAPITR